MAAILKKRPPFIVHPNFIFVNIKIINQEGLLNKMIPLAEDLGWGARGPILAPELIAMASQLVPRMQNSIIFVKFSAVIGDIKKPYGLPSFSVKYFNDRDSR